MVTEYAWPVTGCDPCPSEGVVLGLDELSSLGLDVMPIANDVHDSTPSFRRVWGHALEKSLLQPGFDGFENRRDWPDPGEFVITRLHLRLAPGDTHQDDIVLRLAGPIEGGVEYWGGASGPRQAVESYLPNSFQARYAIRHRWTGPTECEQPIFERWGGPPSSEGSWRETVPTRTPAYLRTTRSVHEFLEAREVLDTQDFHGTVEAEAISPVEPLAHNTRCSVDPGTRGELWTLLTLLGLWFTRRRALDRVLQPCEHRGVRPATNEVTPRASKSETSVDERDR